MTRLEQLRVAARLTPEELASRAGLAAMTVRRVEQGKPATQRTLWKLADYFGVPEGELLLDVLPETHCEAA